MKNKEKYANELISFFSKDDISLCKFRQKHVLKRDCHQHNILCDKCLKMCEKWLEKES